MNPIALFILVLSSLEANAYIGPGVGVGVIGTVIGLLGSLSLAFFAVLYYPIKRALTGRKKGSGPSQQKQ
ncbi:MAG: hypothetical protein ABL958_21095 [Bdellovibrionia bacterium]